MLRQAVNMNKFIRATTTPVGDIFTYRCSRLITGNAFRNGPNLIDDHQTAKRLNDLKPGRLTPESIKDKETDYDPDQALVIYLWTLSENLTTELIDLDFIRSMVEGGASMAACDKYGQTILHALVRDWHPDTIRFAEEQCIDLNSQDHFGVTALHLAAGMNLKESTEELLRHGANPNIETFADRQTPMHYAAKYNGVDALKVLIKYKGDINKPDEMKRTPLFVAAEYGRAEAVQYLMDMGAPTAVTNSFGVSAMSFIAEKMPAVAYNALSQFVDVDTAKMKKKWFIYNFENYENRGSAIEKSVLELIAIYDQFELASHPVVQKAIECKWQLYGKSHTSTRLVLTMLHLILWLVLAYEFQDNHNYYTPLKTNGWKIALEALIILSWAYFFWEEMKKKQIVSIDHRRWVASKEQILTKNLKNCHPTWQEEKKYLMAEFERVKNAPSLAVSGRVWYIYEWVYLFIILTVVATRLADHFMQDSAEDRAKLLIDPDYSDKDTRMTAMSRRLFLAHKMMFSLGLVFAFLRICKFLCAFRAMGVFLRLSALSVESFIQFLLLFIQLYIPLVAAYWALFGNNEENVRLIAETVANSTVIPYKVTYVNVSGVMTPTLDESFIFTLSTLSQLAFSVFEKMVTQSTYLVFWNELEPSISRVLYMISSFLLTFIGFNIFTALVVFTFKTKYSRCTSLATISQITKMLHFEKRANPTTTKYIKKMHKQHCNPLVEPFHHSSNIETEERDLIQDINKSQRQVQLIFDKVKDAETLIQQNTQTDSGQVLRRLQRRMDEFQKKQSNFKTKMDKELHDLVKDQESFVKDLPKLLEKSRKAHQEE